MFLIFVTINHSSYSVMSDYLLDSKYVIIDAYLAVYYLGIALIFALLFIRNILDIHKYKKIYSFSNIFIIVTIICMIISTKENYLIKYSSYLIFFAFMFIQFIVIFTLIKKAPPPSKIYIYWLDY